MISAVTSREIVLHSTIAERDSLLKEVHHRVKNNMQIMISLLNLEMRTLKDTSMAEVFNASINRIRSMSLIHETLYGQEHLDSVELNEYTRRLVGELTIAYEMYRVNIELDLDHVIVSLDQAMPCGLILNELMTNASKYAIAGRLDARIIIRLGTQGSMVIVSVSDDGPGVDDVSKIGSSAGLGMQPIHSLAKQLGGSIVFETRLDASGLRAALSFPHANSQERT